MEIDFDSDNLDKLVVCKAKLFWLPVTAETTLTYFSFLSLSLENALNVYLFSGGKHALHWLKDLSLA